MDAFHHSHGTVACVTKEALAVYFKYNSQTQTAFALRRVCYSGDYRCTDLRDDFSVDDIIEFSAVADRNSVLPNVWKIVALWNDYKPADAFRTDDWETDVCNLYRRKKYCLVYLERRCEVIVPDPDPDDSRDESVRSATPKVRKTARQEPQRAEHQTEALPRNQHKKGTLVLSQNLRDRNNVAETSKNVDTAEKNVRSMSAITAAITFEELSTTNDKLTSTVQRSATTFETITTSSENSATTSKITSASKAALVGKLKPTFGMAAPAIQIAAPTFKTMAPAVQSAAPSVQSAAPTVDYTASSVEPAAPTEPNVAPTVENTTITVEHATVIQKERESVSKSLEDKWLTETVIPQPRRDEPSVSSDRNWEDNDRESHEVSGKFAMFFSNFVKLGTANASSISTFNHAPVVQTAAGVPQGPIRGPCLSRDAWTQTFSTGPILSVIQFIPKEEAGSV